MDALHVVTLAPEEEAYPFLDVSYLFADLRRLPLRDETYDRVVSMSTLEHVGMDNSYYGAGGERPRTTPTPSSPRRCGSCGGC